MARRRTLGYSGGLLIRPHFYFTLALLLTGGACGDAALPAHLPDVDAGSVPLPPTRTLEAVSDTPLRLAPGERATVAFFYRNAGGNALPNQSVAFSFSGQAHDTSLDARFATTDGAGRAQLGLRAGDTPASFRVRADAESADPAFIEVSVGTAPSLVGDAGMSAGP